MNTLDNMYASLLQIQMTARDILEVIQDDPEYITLYDGIVQHMQESAETAAHILDEYFSDPKSARFTYRIAKDMKDIIEEDK